MKILLAVPTFENIYPDTFKSIYNLDKCGNEVDLDFFRGYDVAAARNEIGKATVKGNYDYVLMLDNDEVIPEDGLKNLLETAESYPFIPCMATGYCLTRPTGATNTDSKLAIFKFAGKDYTRQDAYTAQEIKDYRDKGVTKIQIRGSGLGSALIHRSIFVKMNYPWFKWICYSDGKTQLSEDLFFCEQFPVIKSPIYVDTRVSCGHMMRHIEYC